MERDCCLPRKLWIETAEVLFEKLNSVTLSDLIRSKDKPHEKVAGPVKGYVRER
jgi:hypothetical protein